MMTLSSERNTFVPPVLILDSRKGNWDLHDLRKALSKAEEPFGDLPRAELPVLGFSWTAVSKITSKDGSRLPNTRSVASTPSLLAYVAKSTKVRVLHQKYGTNTLLRGHTNPIVDIDAASATKYAEAVDAKDAVGLVSTVGLDNNWWIYLISESLNERSDGSEAAGLAFAPIFCLRMPLVDLSMPPLFEKTLFNQFSSTNVLAKTCSDYGIVSLDLVELSRLNRPHYIVVDDEIGELVGQKCLYSHQSAQKIKDFDVHPSQPLAIVLEEGKHLVLLKLPSLEVGKTISVKSIISADLDSVRMLDSSTAALVSFSEHSIYVVHWGPTAATSCEVVQTIVLEAFEQPSNVTFFFSNEHLVFYPSVQSYCYVLAYGSNKHRFVRCMALPLPHGRIGSIAEYQSEAGGDDADASGNDIHFIYQTEESVMSARLAVDQVESFTILNSSFGSVEQSAKGHNVPEPGKNTISAASSSPGAVKLLKPAARESSKEASPPRAKDQTLPIAPLPSTTPSALSEVESVISRDEVKAMLDEIYDKLEKAQKASLLSFSGRVFKIVKGEVGKQSEELAQCRLRDQINETARLEKILQVISNTLNTNVSEMLLKIVKDEVEAKVVPLLTLKLDETVSDIVKKERSTLNSLPAKVDAHLNDYFNSAKTQKRLDGYFSDLVTATAQKTLDKAIKDAFTESLIPGMQEAVSQMFQQVHTTLESGLEHAFNEQKQQRESDLQMLNESLVDKLSGLEAQVRSLQTQIEGMQLQTLAKEPKQVASKPKEYSGSEKADLWLKLDELLPLKYDSSGLSLGEYQRWLEEHSEELETAFFEALGYSDLELLYYLLQDILGDNPQTVMRRKGDSLMVQPLCLSLIHQLSASLPGCSKCSTDQKKAQFDEPKFKTQIEWCRATLQSLDMNDNAMRKERTQVLMAAKSRVDTCTDYLFSVAPNHPLNRPLMILARLIHSLS